MNKYFSIIVANGTAIGKTIIFVFTYFVVVAILKNYGVEFSPEIMKGVNYFYGFAAVCEYTFVVVTSYKKMNGEVVWVKE